MIKNDFYGWYLGQKCTILIMQCVLYGKFYHRSSADNAPSFTIQMKLIANHKNNPSNQSICISAEILKSIIIMSPPAGGLTVRSPRDCIVHHAYLTYMCVCIRKGHLFPRSHVVVVVVVVVVIFLIIISIRSKRGFFVFAGQKTTFNPLSIVTVLSNEV